MLSRIGLSLDQQEKVKKYLEKYHLEKDDKSSAEPETSSSGNGRGSSAYEEKKPLSDIDPAVILAALGIKIQNNQSNDESSKQSEDKNPLAPLSATSDTNNVSKTETLYSSSDLIYQIDSIKNKMADMKNKLQNIKDSGETPRTILSEILSQKLQLRELGTELNEISDKADSCDAPEKVQPEIKSTSDDMKYMQLDLAFDKARYQNMVEMSRGKPMISSKDLISKLHEINSELEHVKQRADNLKNSGDEPEKVISQLESENKSLESINKRINRYVAAASFTISNEGRSESHKTSSKLKNVQDAISATKETFESKLRLKNEKQQKEGKNPFRNS